VADLDELRRILKLLRDPERGCAWDREQTFATIAPYTIEEAYEVDDAIRRAAWAELCDELGDLLLQVVYHAQMADEAGHFDLDDVVAAIQSKVVRRNPHVFAGGPHASAETVARTWESIKARERPGGPFDGIPPALPALSRAAKLVRRASTHGQDDEPQRAWLEPLAALLGAPSPESKRLGARSEPKASVVSLAALMALCAREIARAGADPEALVRDENARFEAHLRTTPARRS
jgi:nucleoside triphosphate diphosphatase